MIKELLENFKYNKVYILACIHLNLSQKSECYQLMISSGASIFA